MEKMIDGKLVNRKNQNDVRYITFLDGGVIIPYYDPKEWILYKKNGINWNKMEQRTLTVDTNKNPLCRKFANVADSSKNNIVHCPYFELHTKDNEVIRLKRAIRILNDVLCWPPNFLNLGDGTMEGMRKVDLGDAMLAFWPNFENGGKWEFWLSGLALSVPKRNRIFIAAKYNCTGD
jgi:hypothetical protein